jgi:hypothetical protein
MPILILILGFLVFGDIQEKRQICLNTQTAAVVSDVSWYEITIFGLALYDTTPRGYYEHNSRT